MTVYIDLYFIFNFAMDLLIILLCRRILGYRRSLKRAFAGALIGAVYAVCVLPVTSSLILILHLFFGALIPLIACGFGNMRRFLRLLLYFYGIGFFLGGALSAALRGFALYLGGESTFYLGITFILLAALVMGVYCLFFGHITASPPARSARSVSLCNGDQSLSFQGYVDTGNVLREPLQHLPVILANESLSRKIYTFYSGGRPYPRKEQANDPSYYEGLSLRMIPCKTVTGKTMLPALKVQAEVDKEVYTVCIALNFARKANYCGFDALIPAKLL